MKLLFMGRKQHAARALEWSVSAGFDVVGVLTDHTNRDSETADIARRCGMPLLTLEETYEEIRSGALCFDVAVSFVYWRILKQPLLGAARLGVLNFHPAPLPQFRGVAGYNLAILHCLEQWGVSAHYVDEGIDTGSIIDCLEFGIDPEEETAHTLESKSQEFLLTLYKKTLRKVLRGEPLACRENVGGTYVSRAQMEEMKRITPGDDIDRKIRAFWFPPYRGAFIEIDGQKYTLVNDFILKELANGKKA